jgi:hypothetical protein
LQPSNAQSPGIPKVCINCLYGGECHMYPIWDRVPWSSSKGGHVALFVGSTIARSWRRDNMKCAFCQSDLYSLLCYI